MQQVVYKSQSEEYIEVNMHSASATKQQRKLEYQDYEGTFEVFIMEKKNLQQEEMLMQGNEYVEEK